MKKGFTIIEVLVGIFLILVVFLGIMGGYQLAIKVVGQSRNRVTATSVASGELEKIRNLPYQDVGVLGDYPDGVLEAEKTATINNIDYIVKTRIDYVVDEADGIGSPEDDCPNDYKKVEIRVSWPGFWGGEVLLASDIAPENLVQECEIVGGILSISVFDAFGVMVPNPLIEIKNPLTGEVVKDATPDEGEYLFSLPAETYKIEVSKNGYSTSRTYGIDEIAEPEKAHTIAIEGKVEEISFPIDKLSSLSIDTLSPWGTDNFLDSFSTDAKISASSSIEVAGGEVNLISGQSSGYLISTTITPVSLIGWDEFSWTDEEVAGTEILYQVLYFDGASWTLIPGVDLPGNSPGFSVSSVDLSSLDHILYSQLRIKGNLSTTNSFSPTLHDWQVSWRNSAPTPISFVSFNLRGDKIIGRNALGDTVYKYFQDHTTDGTGNAFLPGIEWDIYTFTIDPAEGLNLIETDPSPVSLFPDSILNADLFLQAQNSLLITVQDQADGSPVFSADVRLFKTGYDITQQTSGTGKTFFIPLSLGTYALEVQAPGFTDYSGSIDVSGNKTKIINLERTE